MKGMELSLYLSHLGKTEDDLRKDWEKEAEKQVAYTLIIKRIAKDKDIKPSSEEVDEASNQMIQALALKGQLDKDNINLEELKDQVAIDLTNEKVFALLEKTCIS